MDNYHTSKQFKEKLLLCIFYQFFCLMCIVLETLKEKYVFTAIVTQMPLLSFLKKAKIAKIKQKLKISAFYLLRKLLANFYVN